MGKEWKFTQQSGDKRTLTLAGASAPHGRPRKNPVVSDGIELRHSETYYPDGGNRPPTRHVFGTKWAPWELKGRFSDVWLGKGGTKALISEWQSFVADGQTCNIVWGDVLHATGLVTKFVPDRESEFEGAYAISVAIDTKDTLGGREQTQLPVAPTTLCLALQAELGANISVIPTLPNAGDLKPDFLDTLEELVSNINSFSASLIDIAGTIDAFEDATFDQLERLRAGVAQIRTAIHILQGTVETTENDAAMLSRAADSDVQWFAARATYDVSATAALAILEELDREAELARRGHIFGVYVAKFGDSWESIATQFFGGPEDAGDIRNANGVLYGASPTPGHSYQIPVA